MKWSRLRSATVTTVVAIASVLLIGGAPANAQSPSANQIIGGILQQLSQPQGLPQGVPHSGVYARRYNNVPFGGTTSISITNDSGQPLRLSFSLPYGGGSSISGVPPLGNYTKTGLAKGTSFAISGPFGTQDFVLASDDIRLRVTGDGRLLINSNNGGGGGVGPGPPPHVVGAIKVTNRSNQDVHLAISPGNSGGLGTYTDRVLPGDEWIKELPVGSRVSVNAGQSQEFSIDNGLTKVFVRSDGTIGTGHDWGGYQPNPGPGLAAAGIVIRNDTSANVRATFRLPFSSRETIAIIVAGNTYTRDNLAEGTRVTLSGSFPSETVSLVAGRIERITIEPNGRVQVGHRPGPPSPPSGGAADVEVVNRSGSDVVANFGISVKTIRNNSGHTFQNLDAGRVVQITSGDYTATFTHTGRTERITVRPSGQFDDLPSFARVTQTANVPPIVDPPYNPSKLNDGNPDPPTNNNPPVNTDPPVIAPANALPLPEAAPLKEAVVARFARKTIDETNELIDFLLAGTEARAKTLADEITKAGVDDAGVDLLKQSAINGEPGRTDRLAQQFDNGSRNALSDQLTTLTTIAKIREQLLPLKQKIATGATSSSLGTMLSALSSLSTNVGDAGLTAAVGRIRRDLLIRDTIAQGLEITGVGQGQMSLPQGEVNVISHPWITKGNTYFAESGLILVGSTGPEVLVAKMQAVDALRLPINKGAEAIPDAESPNAAQQVVVLNPAATRTKLSFKIDDRDNTLAAGEQAIFAAGPNRIIEFSRGSSGVVSRFDISQPGIYAFSAGDDGWQLARQSVDIEITNPKHSSAITYVIDGLAKRLDPGKTDNHSSNEPISIYFDGGDGVGTVAKRFADDAKVHFAIDEETGYWNLFAGPAPTPPKAGGNVAKIERPTLADIKSSVNQKLFEFGDLGGTSGGNLIDNLLKP